MQNMTVTKHCDALNSKQRRELTLWRALLPYGYSYKAFCARPG